MDRRSKLTGPAFVHLAPTARMRPITPGGAPGQVVASKYELEEEIGRGAMGIVWRATHRDWQAPVAVKMSTLTDASIARRYFANEARVEAQLRGDHLVHVFENGVDDATGIPFIVMELLDGVTLRDRLDQQGTLAPSALLAIMLQVACVVSRAHAKNLVHRDLKPDNIFLAQSASGEVVKVLDCGVAAPVVENLDRETLHTTADRNIAGTPWYMSPEHINGAAVDTRADLWSLAVIACECLTGKKPFDARNRRSLERRLWSNERPVPSSLGPVPAGFDAWFAKATSLEGPRFATVDELVEALRPVCNGNDLALAQTAPLAPRPIRTERPSTLPPVMHTQHLERPHSWRRRGIAVALTLGIAASALWAIPRWRAHPARVPTASATAPVSSPPSATVPPTATTPAPIAEAAPAPPSQGAMPRLVQPAAVEAPAAEQPRAVAKTSAARPRSRTRPRGTPPSRLPPNVPSNEERIGEYTIYNER